MWKCDNPDTITLALPTIEAALARLSFQEDKERALKTTNFLMYKDLKNLDGLTEEEYLKLGMPVTYIQVFSACRLAGNFVLNICHNKIKYSIKLFEKCQLCNQNKPENIQHLFIECPVYEIIRQKYLNSRGLIDILCDYNISNIKKVFYYMINLIKMRASILNDI